MLQIDAVLQLELCLSSAPLVFRGLPRDRTPGLVRSRRDLMCLPILVLEMPSVSLINLMLRPSARSKVISLAQTGIIRVPFIC